MSEEQFSKLFKYMQEMRQDIRRQCNETNVRIDTYADAVAKQSETYIQEMLAPSHKVDHLERYFKNSRGNRRQARRLKYN